MKTDHSILTESSCKWMNRTLQLFMILCNLLMIDVILYRYFHETLSSVMIYIYHYWINVLQDLLYDTLIRCVHGFTIGLIYGSICMILFGLPTYFICTVYEYICNMLM